MIERIKRFFSDSKNTGKTFQLNICGKKATITKISDGYKVADTDTSLTFSESNLPEFLRYAVDSQPDQATLDSNAQHLEMLQSILDQKKSEGLLVEVSPNRYQTTSGIEYELKIAFGLLWIIKHSADGGVYYHYGEAMFDKLVGELLSSGFISDSNVRLHYKHIRDRANESVNFPDNYTQKLVMDLIRDAVELQGLSGKWFAWGVEGSPLIPDSGEPTLYLLLNGKKVAKPYISDDRLRWEIFEEKELLKKVLPEFETDNIKPTRMKVSDVLKVADSIQTKTMRLYSPPMVVDVFMEDGKKSLLVNGCKSVVADSLVASSPEVENLIGVPLLAERIDVPELLNMIYKLIIHGFQASIFYMTNQGLVSGRESNRLNILLEDGCYQSQYVIEAFHRRVTVLGGNSMQYSNPATWSTFTGIAQVVSEFPYSSEMVISNALSIERLIITTLQQIIDFTDGKDVVTHQKAVECLSNRQNFVKSLQDVLVNLVNLVK